MVLTEDAQVKEMQFGVALTANTTPGILGIGYPTNEATNFTYPNLIDQMLAQGLVESRTYSIYLDDLEASTGTILFGGVDLEAFSGSLYTLPINGNSSESISEFFITLTDVTLTSPCGCTTDIGRSSSYPMNVLLDTGTTDSCFPTEIANAIAQEFGAKVDEFGNFNLPNCDLQFAAGSLNFDFSGVKISVPYSEIVQEDDGECSLGIEATDGNCGILGDSFLRSAYLVFDLVCYSCSSF